MIFLFKQPGLALIRRNQKYIVVRSILSLPRRRMVPPAATVAAEIFRVRFYSSLPQRRMARLQTAANPQLQ